MHARDADCKVDEATGLCGDCGTLHGDPCEGCGGEAFHREGCDARAVAMSARQVRAAALRVREHYGLTRPVTDTEVRAEVANLLRRGRGNLDDGLQRVAAMLHTGEHAVELWA